MAGRRKRSPPVPGPVPRVYREMLAEAGANSARDQQSPPLKRRRPGARRIANRTGESSAQGAQRTRKEDGNAESVEDDELDDIEFEDVSLPAPTLQTITMDSEDEDEDDDDDDIKFEDVDLDLHAFQSPPASTNDPFKDLNLNLTAQKAAMKPRRSADRRKPVTKEERLRRVDVHKVHLLCLLSHVALRNRWCNSPEIQAALRPLLSAKMIRYLNPGSHLSQFGRTESLKNGLQQVTDMFRIKFAVTERGIRRALWAEDANQLQDVETQSTSPLIPC